MSNDLDDIQTKMDTLNKLYDVKVALGNLYPEMDLTDFEMAIYSLEDDLSEVDE